MAPIRVCLLLKILIIQMCTVRGQSVTKGSLAFVIDDTFSMTDDIEQVRDGASAIFKTVTQANDSQIQNYVVVTFNDPSTGRYPEPEKASFRITTENENELEKVLSNLKVSAGNDDCPEYAMTGIALALEKSLPFSYLFIFTDATAKDYQEYERVKRIAQKKQSQVVFALTGDCRGSRDTPEYRIYHELAEATSGQVFHIDKNQVKDILKYVKETVTGRRNLIGSYKFSPGRGHKFNFTIDSKTGSTTIAVSGLNPDINIIGPDGNKPEFEIIASTDETKIMKMTDPKPGMYFAEAGSDSNTAVIITGKSNIYFEHGFSQFTPTSIGDTATRPAHDGQAFLSIKMKGEGVIPQIVKILNMDNSVLMELPLDKINEKEQFYGTKQFNPPNTMFRMEVVGYDVNDKAPVVRRAQTSIERLPREDDDGDKKISAAPTITIQGESQIAVDYEAPLQLMCKVHAYPEPAITWKVKDTGVSLAASVYKLEANEYMSILKVNKSVQNCTYQCTAGNAHGEISRYVDVVTKTYFNVIEIPQNKTIEYDTADHFTCKVDAVPPASLIWYKDSTIISNGSNILISGDSSVITIKQMQLDLIGNFKCEASNKFNVQEFNFYVGISGVEKPKIDKQVLSKNVRRGTQAVLMCRIVQGKPKPTIRWEFRDKQTNVFKELRQYTEEQLELRDVTTHDAGSYKCIANNAMGSDDLIVEVLVEYPPKIDQDNKKTIIANDRNAVSLMCSVDGIPPPSVEWYKNDTRIEKTRILKDNSVRFTATLNDIGSYTCVAVNKLGTAKKTVFLDIHAKPIIDKQVVETRVRNGTNAELTCRLVQGNPKPTIRWEFRDKQTNIFKELRQYTEEQLELRDVTTHDAGSYKCIANNAMGSDDLIVEVLVEYPPKIYQDNKKTIIANDRDAVSLMCSVDGIPSPSVEWYKNDTRIEKTRIFKDNSLRFTATLNCIGSYTCVAVNSLGTANKTVFLDIHVKPRIDKKVVEMAVREGTHAVLTCRLVQGNPTPTIRWEFRDKQTNVFRELGQYTEEQIELRDVTTHDVGSYKCIASNVIGSDDLIVDLSVQYPPTIKPDDKKTMLAKYGDMVSLMCAVDGIPTPSVEWYKDDTRIEMTRIFTDNSVRINATLDDTGSYTCIAKNSIGNAIKTVSLDVYVPITIDTPDETTVIEMVGSDIMLPCMAYGYPEPEIQWIFYGSDSKEARINARDIKETSVTLTQVQINQEGAYICIASNVHEAVSINYTVSVLAPPAILNMYTTDTFAAVVGDLALRIQCNATGRPKPTIYWLKDESPINVDTDGYEQDEDGALVIYNIDVDNSGIYVCRAENNLGNVSAAYEVMVDKYPQLNIHHEYTSPSLFIEVGSSADIECQIPHSDTDQLRWYFWYENAIKIVQGELWLHEVSANNEGFYTCRVSNLYKSQSAHTYVKIGRRPVFIIEEGEEVEINNLHTPLVCQASGQPQPTVVWHYNGAVIKPQNTKYTLTDVQAGVYECSVFNLFGRIQRTFNVVQEDCELDTKHDFLNLKQPLIASDEHQKWPPYNVTHGYMVIPKYESIHMFCPKGFHNITSASTDIVATCLGGENFYVEENIMKYSDIKCTTVPWPININTRGTCLGNNQIWQIGFNVSTKFYPVYDVCRNKRTDLTLYTKHILKPGLTNVARNLSKQMKSTHLPRDILFECKRPTRKITNIKGRWCFDMKQLVNYRDLHPNVPVTASHHHRNIIPYWNSCNSKNWDEVERRIRSLADAIGRDLQVFTGVAGKSSACLIDSNHRLQPTPLYLWKVVEDQQTSASLAIIQVNVPNLSRTEASRLVRCEDICSRTVWMGNPDWHDATKGYVYCCTVADFDRKFYNGQFRFQHRKILDDLVL